MDSWIQSPTEKVIFPNIEKVPLFKKSPEAGRLVLGLLSFIYSQAILKLVVYPGSS
jgi:hypothetical protein